MWPREIYDTYAYFSKKKEMGNYEKFQYIAKKKSNFYDFLWFLKGIKNS